jgi:hypothetical protein
LISALSKTTVGKKKQASNSSWHINSRRVFSDLLHFEGTYFCSIAAVEKNKAFGAGVVNFQKTLFFGGWPLNKCCF